MSLNETMKDVKRTLIDHGKKFDILTRDVANKHAREPYDEKEPDDESTCTALFEMAMAKTTAEVENWIKRVDVSLVFIALFSAVLTAFLIPATQSLIPSSNFSPSQLPGPVPPVSLQNICVLWYLALILSVLDAETTIENDSSVHALRYEASPFGGALTSLVLALATIGKNLAIRVPATIVHLIRWIYTGSFNLSVLFFPISIILIPFLIVIVPFWIIVAFWRVKVDTQNQGKLVGTYMELISEGGDPDLLERVVPSFSYQEWIHHGKGSVTHLEKAYNRLMATDMSTRVHETLKTRFQNLIAFYRSNSSGVKNRLKNDFISFVVDRCSFPQDFHTQVFITSLGKDNDDLSSFSSLSFEACVVSVLCSYDRLDPVGNRTGIFDLAQTYTSRLIREQPENALDIDRCSCIKSLTQHPRSVNEVLIEYIVRDHRTDILRCLNDFLRHIDHGRLNPDTVFQVFLSVSESLPPDIDISPIIRYASRHSDSAHSFAAGARIVSHLYSRPFSQISDPVAVLAFLQTFFLVSGFSHVVTLQAYQHPEELQALLRAWILIFKFRLKPPIADTLFDLVSTIIA
ncbi:hypothetical protein SISNIDRAFT_491416 [Sistotremastrum niveocremeum HHB9708]|uniref:DUF6535 domain-containing protein n=1 Tax=Sistotremastrum niveocremeum HHB9708 TaxID=1314777 RepID=A0A164MTD3_9AGAM|nr:hypothetical protein SISNIDRAFT_491416 [Sistotremastrum niveocremeum HHB9708]